MLGYVLPVCTCPNADCFPSYPPPFFLFLTFLVLFVLIASPSAELGHVLHPCEGDLVCKCTNEKVPYFNAPVFLENKSQIGKVDDVFGPMNDFVSLNLAELFASLSQCGSCCFLFDAEHGFCHSACITVAFRAKRGERRK